MVMLSMRMSMTIMTIIIIFSTMETMVIIREAASLSTTFSAHAYIHTYIHTYISYIHTCIHTDRQNDRPIHKHICI